MRRTINVVAGQAAAFVLQLMAVVFAARLLGAKGQGEFSIVRTAVYLGEGVLWLGLNSGFSYFVSANFSRYYRTGLRFSLCHLGIMLVLIFSILEVAQRCFPAGKVAAELYEFDIPMFCWITTYALIQLCQRALISAQEFEKGNILSILNAGLVFPALIIGVRYITLSVNMVILTNIMANMVTLAYGMVALKATQARKKPLANICWADGPDMYKVGFKGFVSTIAFLMLYRLDFFLVGHFLGIKMAGIYAVAAFIIEAMQKVADWLGTILTPRVAAGQDEDGRLTRVYARVGFAVVLICGMALGAIVLSGGHVIQRALGEGYSGIDLLVLLLIPRGLLHAIMVTHAGFLSGRGYTIYHPVAGMAAVLTLVLADLWLIPHYGIHGAVLGITAGYVVACGIMVMGFNRFRCRPGYPAMENLRGARTNHSMIQKS